MLCFTLSHTPNTSVCLLLVTCKDWGRKSFRCLRLTSIQLQREVAILLTAVNSNNHSDISTGSLGHWSLVMMKITVAWCVFRKRSMWLMLTKSLLQWRCKGAALLKCAQDLSKTGRHGLALWRKGRVRTVSSAVWGAAVSTTATCPRCKISFVWPGLANRLLLQQGHGTNYWKAVVRMVGA